MIWYHDVKTLKALSLREQAGHVIRAGIVSGERSAVRSTRRPCSPGVSATPVREAMLDLANAGLGEAVRNRGFRVLVPHERDLDEIGELRLMVEDPATRLVVERAADADLAALERVVADLESSSTRAASGAAGTRPLRP